MFSIKLSKHSCTTVISSKQTSLKVCGQTYKKWGRRGKGGEGRGTENNLLSTKKLREEGVIKTFITLPMDQPLVNSC